MKESVKSYKRIVVKIGSSLFYNKGQLDRLRFFDIVGAVNSLIAIDKKEIIIVSSGAIALGMDILKESNRPKELSFLQAAAAIGQSALMENYNKEFKRHGIHCAQILLTWDDFDNRNRYLNAKKTLLALLKLGVVPIINENDTISTDEIKFGDNDTLSARVAALISADLLIILSDVDGLLDKNKNVIPVVGQITPEIKALACPTNKKTCVGGMITKIEAAKIAIDSGIPCVIANGRRNRIIHSVMQCPDKFGTLFVNKKKLTERERWLAFGTKPKAKIIVDDGAKLALLNKKSLLSVGVTALEGSFDVDNIISIVDKQGNEFGRGKAMLSSKQLDKVKGMRTDKEVVHCDNIVIL